MRFASTFKVLGLLLMIFSLSMLPPIGVALIYGDGSIQPFIVSFLASFGCGAILWSLCRRVYREIKVRDGFLVVVLFWMVLSAFGAIPFVMDPAHHLNFTNAFFIAVSGLTTTGAAILTHLNHLPHAILYYRQQLHFLGGMGIIVLAVAILPMLGIGGMQLAKAEVSGPVKNTKLKPRMAETAKALWMVYVGLTALCAMGYWLAGMSVFDAVGEAFSTVSTGGFSIHSASFAFYHNTAINVVAIIFMLLGALNFNLHFRFMQEKRLSTYFKDSEFRAYITFLLFVICLITVMLESVTHYGHWWRHLMDAAFTVISMSSTTGLTITGFSHWPTFVPYLIMIVALIGGCSGSTAGGLKIIRVIVLRAQAKREFMRLLHPQAVVVTKLKNQTMSSEVIQAVWAFVSVFLFLFVVLLLILMADGNGLATSFSALAACISNTGAGIAGIADGFGHLTLFSKWVLIFAMLAGRLEVFTLLVLFMPSFWRK